MHSPLLSSYRTGENRVTASTMAVFERIDLTIVEELLAGATESGDELRTVTFENQVKGSGSVPDACIRADFCWFFETKTERGVYDHEGKEREQLCKHSTLLVERPDAILFVLTPDASKPPWLDALDGIEDHVHQRIIWFGFANLAAQIEALLADHGRLIAEQTRYLLHELVRLYEDDGLLQTDDTVVVAARRAWPEYHEHHAYICQAGRFFRPDVTRLGFYTDRAIQALVPKIIKRHGQVLFTVESAEVLRSSGKARLAEIIEGALAANERTPGEHYDVFELSGVDHEDTVRLNQPIRNDLISSSGGTVAWTQNQRYVRLDALRRAKVTSDL